MATFNLVRNSRVFFTTNVNASTGVVQTTSHTTATTKELMVLDGFTFSQGTNVDTIQISEAGNTPVRGQRSFNTSLNNVEFSFSTYIRPYNATTAVTATESVLWNALMGSVAIGSGQITVSGITAATYATATGQLTVTGTAITATGSTLNAVYHLSGITGLGASWLNAPAKLTASAAGSLTFTLLNPPAPMTITPTATNLKLNTAAWFEHPTAASDTTITTPYSMVTTAMSNKNQLQAFGMIFVVDGVMYLVDNCAMDSATIDFGLDGIATVQWSGKGTALRSTDAPTMAGSPDPTFTGTLTGTAYGKANTAVSGAAYITNKLSTVDLISNIGGISGTTYTLALTGGSVTIANNISYVVPANLGVVNQAIGYYTGTRSVSGSINAYLRTGTAATAGLLANLLAAASTTNGIEPKFQLKLDVGGSTNGNRVNLWMYGCNLQIPTVDAQAVMSTTINFTAQGTDAMAAGAVSNYDLESTNDIFIRYFAA